jgi:hypothetical protein
LPAPGGDDSIRAGLSGAASVRIIFLFGAAFAFVSGAGSAQQQSVIELHPGEQVTVQIDSAGHMIASRPQPAKLSDFELQTAVKVIPTHPEAVGPNSFFLNSQRDNLPEPGPVKSKTIRIAFFGMPSPAGGEQRLLILENGYGQAFHYRAALARGDRVSPTDVCTVLPRLRGFEQWPYAIDRIELGDLELVQYEPGTAPVCE